MADVREYISREEQLSTFRTLKSKAGNQVRGGECASPRGGAHPAQPRPARTAAREVTHRTTPSTPLRPPSLRSAALTATHATPPGPP